MTDLREAFGSLIEGEPESTRIDATAAVRTSRGRARRRHAWVASGVAAVAVVAVCAVVAVPHLGRSDGRPAPVPADRPSGSPAMFDPSSISCEYGSDWVTHVTHLPADVGPITAAYLCEVVDRSVPGDGVWQYQVVREVTGGLPALEEALAVPDAPRNSGMCTLQFDIGRPIWVVGQRSALVRVPLDGCGHAVQGAKDVLEQLPTKVVSEKRTRQMETQTAVDSGCSQDFKDMLRVESADNRLPDVEAPPQLDESMRWTVCRYDVVSQDGGGGSLTSADRLTPKQVTRLNAALAASHADPSCRRDDHTRFATVIDVDGSNYWLDVALDGCAVQRGSDWWRADPEVRRLLGEPG
jgi:hypothetical protein